MLIPRFSRLSLFRLSVPCCCQPGAVAVVSVLPDAPSNDVIFIEGARV